MTSSEITKTMQDLLDRVPPPKDEQAELLRKVKLLEPQQARVNRELAALKSAAEKLGFSLEVSIKLEVAS